MSVNTRSRHGMPSLVAVCAAALVACSTAQPSRTVTQTPMSHTLQVDEIQLESNCFGCASGSVLNLHRDGRAELMSTGNARFGTVDRMRRGRLGRPEFDALVRLLVEEGFFALAEVYEDPSIQDGAWAAVRVGRAGEVKQVWRRGDAAPPALRRVEAAILALQSRIAFDADPLDRGTGK